MKTSARPDPGRRRRRRQRSCSRDTLPGAARARQAASTSRSRTRSARRSPRSAARSTGSSRSRARPATRRSTRPRRRRSRRRSRPAPSATAVRDRRRRGRAARLPAGQRDADPGQGGRRPRPREGGRCGWSVRPSSTTSPSARRSSAPAAAATRTSASCSRRRPSAGTARCRSSTVDEVPDDAFVVPSAMMGAPTVMVEKLPRGDEVINAFKALGSYIGREPTHTMSIEAGGLNSTTPFVVAAQLGIPLVDADGMGRAFPEIQMFIADHATASPRRRWRSPTRRATRPSSTRSTTAGRSGSRAR